MAGLGTVPQVFAVVQPVDVVYRMAFFRKVTIKEFNPSSPPPGYYFGGTDMKEYLLIKLHNAMHMVKQCPPMHRLYQVPRAATIASLAEKFPKSNKRFKGANPDMLTVDLIQGKFSTDLENPPLRGMQCKVGLGNQKYKTKKALKSHTPSWNDRWVFNLAGAAVSILTNR